MKTCSSRGNERRQGTTLIEVMFGIVLLAIMALVVPAAIRFPRFAVVSAAQKQAALYSANVSLEEAFAAGYDGVDARAGTLLESGLYGRMLTNTLVVTDLGGGIKGLVVMVDYPGGDEPVRLETLIAQAR